MKIRQTLILTILCVAAISAWQAFQSFFPQERNLKLVLKANVGGQPFERNKFAYDNPGGNGKFRVTNFRFYLSDVQFDPGQGGDVHSVPDSYHLARFGDTQGVYELQFKELPFARIEGVSFAIGVDATANTSLEVRGDLDPNSQMAWNWEVGYKFVLLEGALQTDDGVTPLVYHVGFSENRRKLDFTLTEPLALSSESQIEFDVDLLKFFNGATTLDLATTNSVKFDKNDARALADNYSRMISLTDTQ